MAIPAVSSSDADDLAYCVTYLRRKYPDTTTNNASLASLADEVFNASTEDVTLIATSFQGGYAGAIKNFNRRILGMALEIILAERVTGYVKPSAGTVIHFSI